MFLWIILTYFYREKEPEIERSESVNFLHCRGKGTLHGIHDSQLHVLWTLMSESEGEQNGEDGYESPDLEERAKKSVSKLEWRSPALTQVMQSLNRKITRRRSSKGRNMLVERRHTGIISSRLAPDDANENIYKLFCLNTALLLLIALQSDARFLSIISEIRGK